VQLSLAPKLRRITAPDGLGQRSDKFIAESKSDGDVSSAEAILAITSSEGLRTPRSMPEM